MADDALTILENVIQEVLSVNYNDPDCYEKVYAAYQRIPYLPIFQHTLYTGSQIFRSRPNRTKDFFTSIDEITYPKPEFIKNFGRLNCPGQSIFYCSENRPTSYMELTEMWAEEVGFGETFFVTISEWILQRDINLVMIVNPNKAERKTEYDKMHGEAFDQKLSECTPEQQKIGYRFYEFISQEFFKPAKKDLSTYIKTCAFGNLALSYFTCDGLIYPSVPFMGDGFNIVLRPEIVDRDEVIVKSVLRNKIRAEEQENGKHHFIDDDHQFAKKIDLKTRVIEW